MSDAPFYSGTSYETPEDRGVRLPYRSPVGRSLWFHTTYFMGEFRRVRRAAIRGRLDRARWRQSSEVFARHIERTGARIHVQGLDVLDQVEGAAVIVGNHMSLIETFLLPAMVLARSDVSFVVKRSLTTHPLFGPIMRAVESIAVSRENPREDLKVVMSEGVRHLKAGRFVCVFPQTTRMVGFDAEKFNSIGVKLASRAGVPVIPLALKTDFMLNGRIIKDLGTIHPEREIRFAFGPPIRLDECENTRAMHEAVVEFIEAKLRGWGMPVAD